MSDSSEQSPSASPRVTTATPRNDIFTTNSAIDDADIAAARATIGQPLRLPARFNRIVNEDSVRHFANGYGDDNPLYCDADYARGTALGSIVAPPTFLYSVFPAGIGPGFSGLQGFHGGSRWQLERHLRPGEEIFVEGKLLDVQDVHGRSGRTIIEIGLAEYRTASGELVASNISRLFRKPRPGADGAMAVKPREPYVLSAQERDAVETAILTYPRRGAEARYWEDTQLGETIPNRFKGPLELNDIIAFSIAVGNVHSAELALKLRHAARTRPDTVPNNRPVGWLTERVTPGSGHMDPTVARAVGMPTLYDNGWLRMCWLAQLVTDWMGDDARLLVLDAKLRLPNLVGDVLTLSATVKKKDERGIIELDIVARRQDGAVSCDGSATVLLACREQPGPIPPGTEGDSGD